MNISKQITLTYFLCCLSCAHYQPKSICYVTPDSNKIIPQLDSAQIMDYICQKGEQYHLIYCYGGGCAMCDDLLPSFLAFSRKENIPHSVMIIERATDSLLVNFAIKKIYQASEQSPPIIILSDSLYDIEYRYKKPQTERLSPFISYGHNGKGDCNKYDRFLEKCVPDYKSYWHPRILLYQADKGVIFDAKNYKGTAFTAKEKRIILNLIQ